MAGYSPFPAGTPGLVPISGPNGTFMVPEQIGGAFGVQGAPPIAEPLPTFDPAELQPPPIDMPAPVDPASLAPQPAPPPPGPPTLADVTGQVDQTIAGIQQRQDTEQPRDATGMAMGALGDQRRILRAGAALEGAQGRDEAAVYRAQAEADAAAEKQRAAERERHGKEVESTRAELRSAQDAYANHKVDQNRAWKDMGTGRQIAAAIGIALSGIGGALVARDTGRPVTNPALDVITAAMERDTRLQLADRDKLNAVVGMKRDAIADLRQKYSDGEAAYEGILAGNLRRVETQVKGIAATAKDPQAKLKMENLSAEIGIKAAEVGQKAEDRELAAKQQAIENKRAQSQLGLGWANFRAGEKRDERDFAEGRNRWEVETGLKVKAADAALLKAQAEGNAAAVKLAREEAELARKEEAELRNLTIGGGTKRVEFDKDGLPRVVREPLMGADKKPWKAPDILAPKLQAKKAAVDNIVRLMDDTVNLIDAHGQEADFIKSPAWQKMQANWGSMAIDEKTISELGVLAGPDMELIARKLGTGDPTQIRDTTPGLRQARRNTIDKFNTDLIGAGYDGKPYDITEQTSAGVQDSLKNTPLQDTMKTAEGKVRPRDDLFFVTGEGLKQVARGEKPTTPMTPTARASIEGAAALAKQGHSGGLAALTQLGKSADPEIRTAAREAAKRAGVSIPWPKESK